MKKTNQILVRLTNEQKEILRKKTYENGFIKLSDYIRYFLFLDDKIEKKLDLILSEVQKNDKQNENNIFSNRIDKRNRQNNSTMYV